MARDRRQYSDDFKKQMVELYNSGKPRCEIIREYELIPSALSSWINKYNATSSFNINDIHSEEEKKLLGYIKNFNNYEWKMIF